MKDYPIVAGGASPSPIQVIMTRPAITSYSAPVDSYSSDISALVVKMQGPRGICTMEVVVSYLEKLIWKSTGVYVELSVADLAIKTKLLVDKDQIEGSSIWAAFTAAKLYGVCKESTFPTNVNLSWIEFINQTIPESAAREALNYKIGWFEQVPVDPVIFAGCIRLYDLVAVRFELGKEWYTAVDGRTSWEAQDIFPLRPPASIIDGHANLVYAYGDGPAGAFDLNNNKNSWSKLWGSKDYQYDAGNGFFYHSQYKPTEAWIAGLVAPTDNSPQVTFQEVEEIIQVMRNIGIIK
jgi:hypothetical protein